MRVIKEGRTKGIKYWYQVVMEKSDHQFDNCTMKKPNLIGDIKTVMNWEYLVFKTKHPYLVVSSARAEFSKTGTFTNFSCLQFLEKGFKTTIYYNLTDQRDNAFIALPNSDIALYEPLLNHPDTKYINNRMMHLNKTVMEFKALSITHKDKHAREISNLNYVEEFNEGLMYFRGDLLKNFASTFHSSYSKSDNHFCKNIFVANNNDSKIHKEGLLSHPLFEEMGIFALPNGIWEINKIIYDENNNKIKKIPIMLIFFPRMTVSEMNKFYLEKIEEEDGFYHFDEITGQASSTYFNISKQDEVNNIIYVTDYSNFKYLFSLDCEKNIYHIYQFYHLEQKKNCLYLSNVIKNTSSISRISIKRKSIKETSQYEPELRDFLQEYYIGNKKLSRIYFYSIPCIWNFRNEIK